MLQGEADCKMEGVHRGVGRHGEEGPRVGPGSGPEVEGRGGVVHGAEGPCPSEMLCYVYWQVSKKK